MPVYVDVTNMAAADVTAGLVILGIATLVLLVLVVYVLVKMNAIASRTGASSESNVERRLDDLQRLASLQMQTQEEVGKILAGHSQAIRSLQSQVGSA